MAKQRRFKCSKCDRKFSMAAHLARHMNTLHASKKVKATKKKRRAVAMKRRSSLARPAGRTAAGGLGDAIASMKAYRDHLSAQRSDIDGSLLAIDAALAAVGSGAAPKPLVARRRRGKRPRTGSLKGYIARVLRGLARGKSVGDISTAVKKAGYKSKNKRLNHSVGKVLADMKNVTRVERGVYRLK